VSGRSRWSGLVAIAKTSLAGSLQSLNQLNRISYGIFCDVPEKGIGKRSIVRQWGMTPETADSSASLLNDK
jgi:hypothetical protein